MKRLNRLLCALVAGPALSAVEAKAQGGCIKFDGSQLLAFETRKNVSGKPGELVTKSEAVQSVAEANSKWCVDDSGVTYHEGGQGPAIEIRYPFAGGFVSKTINSHSLPVKITGIAKKSGSVTSVNWQYTIGRKLTEGKAIDTSGRVELSFSFDLSESGCKLHSYNYTYLMNSGDDHHGIFTGKRTRSYANVRCRAA